MSKAGEAQDEKEEKEQEDDDSKAPNEQQDGDGGEYQPNSEEEREFQQSQEQGEENDDDDVAMTSSYKPKATKIYEPPKHKTEYNIDTRRCVAHNLLLVYPSSMRAEYDKSMSKVLVMGGIILLNEDMVGTEISSMRCRQIRVLWGWFHQRLITPTPRCQ